MNTNACPYKVSGVCYRKGCIFLHQPDCMKETEYKEIMRWADKNLSKKQKFVKRHKRI